MATFNPNIIKAASKSVEFGEQRNVRSAKDVVLQGISRQLELFKDAKAEGKRWFVIGKSETLLTIRYSNKALVLKDGEKQVAIPNGQLEAALEYFKGEVAADKYADQLAVMEKANEGRRDKMRATRAAKKTA